MHRLLTAFLICLAGKARGPVKSLVARTEGSDSDDGDFARGSVGAPGAAEEGANVDMAFTSLVRVVTRR